MSRETFYAALFDRLAGLRADGLVKLCDRRVRLIEDMGPAELPALFLAVANQETTQQRGQPSRRILGAKLFLYTANPDRHTAAGVALNHLIDAVEAKLAPDAGEDTQTLGGLVWHLWIESPIEVFEGPAGQRSAAIFSVRMLVP